MNENLDLTKILEGCPLGTKLYSPGFGEVWYKEIDEKGDVIVWADKKSVGSEVGCIVFYSDGRYYYKGECVLFPSRDERDWKNFVRFWDVELISPTPLYWFHITDDTEVNMRLLRKMIELVGDLDEEDLEKDMAEAPNIVFNRGDKAVVWKDGFEGAALIKALGTELKIRRV